MSCGAALVQFVGPATARKAIAQEHRQRQDRRSIERVPSPFLPLPNHHGVGNPSFPARATARPATQTGFRRTVLSFFHPRLNYRRHRTR